MTRALLALLLAGCASTPPIGVLWQKQPDAPTRAELVGDTCVITTRDSGDVPASEFGKSLRECLAMRGKR